MGGFLQKRGLVFSISAGIMGATLVTCSMLTAVGFLNFSNSHTDGVVSSMKKSGESAGKLVDMEIATYIKQVEDIAQRDDIRSMDFSVQQPILADEAKRIGFERFQIGYPDGNVKSTTGHTGFAGDRPFFKSAMAGVSNISDVLFARIDLKMTIVVSAPLYDDSHRIVGILSGVTSASRLNEIVGGVDLDYDGYCFIINKAGAKMAGIDYTGIEKLDNDLEKTDIAGIEGLVEVEKQMVKGGSGVKEFQQDGANYYLSWTPINGGEWILGVVQNKDQSNGVLRSMLKRMIILAIVFVIFGGIFGFFITRALKPLGIVRDSIKEIASGKADLTKRINVHTNNEIGDVVAGFNAFSEKMQSIISVMKKSKDTLMAAGQNLKESTQDTSASITQIIANIDSMGGNISTQSGSVQQTAGAVNEILANIQSLEKMVESQADGVSQASSAVEEMIGNISSVNFSVDKMADSFEALAENARRGADTQTKLSEQISQIEAQSKLLRDANTAIANIASQTNLLAMNAAIEAAHAGDAGKGFAVVSDEIRKLSETSSVQSKTIGEQLKSIQNSIDMVVLSAQDGVRGYTNLANEISEIDALVRQIKAAMEEQNQGSRQITAALHNMNDSTSEVRNASQEMSAGSQEILKEVHALQDATLGMKREMDEMAIGARKINETGAALSEISEEMAASISGIGAQVDQFEV